MILFMKKIIVLLVLILCLCSCKENKTVVYDDPTTALFNEIVHFNYQGHRYIWFKTYEGLQQGWSGGIVHDPDCECMIDYD